MPYRPNAGRKSNKAEADVRKMSQKAIIAKFGSLHKGMQAMLSSGEPSLIKFVFEHALGKAVDLTAFVDPNGKQVKPSFVIQHITAPVPIESDYSDVMEGEAIEVQSIPARKLEKVKANVA